MRRFKSLNGNRATFVEDRDLVRFTKRPVDCIDRGSRSPNTLPVTLKPFCTPSCISMPQPSAVNSLPPTPSPAPLGTVLTAPRFRKQSAAGGGRKGSGVPPILRPQADSSRRPNIALPSSSSTPALHSFQLKFKHGVHPKNCTIDNHK